MKSGGGLFGTLIGFLFVFSVLAMVGLWYVAVFILAGLVFLILWAVSRSQHKGRREVLSFRPGQLVPSEVWEKTKGLPTAGGDQVAEVTIVGLDNHVDNWNTFRQQAEVDRADEVVVRAHAIAYKTPTADTGVIFAYERMVLGHVRSIELEHYFDPIWSRGGIVPIAMSVQFDSAGKVVSAVAHLPMFWQSGGPLQGHEKAAWRAIWGRSRGR